MVHPQTKPLDGILVPRGIPWVLRVLPPAWVVPLLLLFHQLSRLLRLRRVPLPGEVAAVLPEVAEGEAAAVDGNHERTGEIAECVKFCP